uniref:Uncharacterized protein n=1 Tax=Leersia perrieri TaxID=77586 RepID=A0A0D9XZM7_9ORYZ
MNVDDLFKHRPKPSYIPVDFSQVLDAIEEILWRGNPTLIAHECVEIHAQRFF